jgi:hypothetical protein
MREAGNEDRKPTLDQRIQPASRLAQRVREHRDRRRRDGLPLLAQGELDVGLRHPRVVEIADQPLQPLRHVLLRLLAPDLDALRQHPAWGDGTEAEQEAVEAGDAHAAAGLLRQFVVRGGKAGEITLAGGVERHGLELAHDALGR